MNTRRLTLNREALTPLHSDELASVHGAATRGQGVCALTSLNWSYCADTTCGIACTADCPSNNCG